MQWFPLLYQKDGWIPKLYLLNDFSLTWWVTWSGINTLKCMVCNVTRMNIHLDASCITWLMHFDWLQLTRCDEGDPKDAERQEHSGDQLHQRHSLTQVWADASSLPSIVISDDGRISAPLDVDYPIWLVNVHWMLYTVLSQFTITFQCCSWGCQ